jgi:hypothetical protein
MSRSLRILVLLASSMVLATAVEPSVYPSPFKYCVRISDGKASGFTLVDVAANQTKLEIDENDAINRKKLFDFIDENNYEPMRAPALIRKPDYYTFPPQEIGPPGQPGQRWRGSQLSLFVTDKNCALNCTGYAVLPRKGLPIVQKFYHSGWMVIWEGSELSTMPTAPELPAGHYRFLAGDWGRSGAFQDLNLITFSDVYELHGPLGDSLMDIFPGKGRKRDGKWLMPLSKSDPKREVEGSFLHSTFVVDDGSEKSNKDHVTCLLGDPNAYKVWGTPEEREIITEESKRKGLGK